MKLTKMSLVAALLVGSSAFAVDNVKVSGNAQVLYSTTDSKADGYAAVTGHDALFDKDTSAADAGLNLDISADLAKNDLVTVSAAVGYTVVTTLGLENNFVSNVWGGAHTVTHPTGASYANATVPVNGTSVDLGGTKVENANWTREAKVAVSFNQATKSTLAVGRMALDTPLAFTETWSIEQNTFEAAALINQDIPDTTIVAAYVGNGNGTETHGQNLMSPVSSRIIGAPVAGTHNGVALAMAPIVNGDGKFATYGLNGAYALGVVNNSFKPLTAQLWYYDVSKMATAMWLQADLNMDGIMAGLQYSSATLDKDVATALGASDEASSTTALMVGYEMKDTVTAKLAYSMVGDKGAVGAANTATSTGASKLYTEAWWNYGKVTAIDSTAINLTVTSPVNGMFDLGVYYTMVDDGSTADADLTELTLTAGKTLGPVDATLAIISADTKNDTLDGSLTVQAYVTVNF